jgi:hypothetical protein
VTASVQTSGSLIARYVVLSFLGQLVPLDVGVFTIPEIVLEFMRLESMAWTSWRCDRCKSRSSSCSECLPNPSRGRQRVGVVARQIISLAMETR